jgi:hypothetical protein
MKNRIRRRRVLGRVLLFFVACAVLLASTAAKMLEQRSAREARCILLLALSWVCFSSYFTCPF